jgi:hypothetical protein
VKTSMCIHTHTHTEACGTVKHRPGHTTHQKGNRRCPSSRLRRLRATSGDLGRRNNKSIRYYNRCAPSLFVVVPLTIFLFLFSFFFCRKKRWRPSILLSSADDLYADCYSLLAERRQDGWTNILHL